MEQNHHLCSARDTDMDSADDDKHMERMEMEAEEAIGVQDQTRQHLPDGEGPFSSGRGRFRPRLLATKSFPPYSQCVGGLGEDENWDDAPNLESNASPHQSKEREDKREQVQDMDRKTSDMAAKCSREVLRAKWRSRRRGKLGGSFEVGTDGSERGRWSGKRRVKESGMETECENEGRAEGPNSDSKHWRGRSSGLGKEENEEEDEGGLKVSPPAGAQEECSISTETTEQMMEPSTQRHPILSKLLLSSSTSSSCSSINLSSGESDEVFSEEDNAASKRKTFRKSCSWKTFLTMMHWSLRRQSSWVQLAGHQGNFQVSKGGEVLKLYSELEAKCLDSLMSDPLRPFVPQYHGLVTRGEHCYIRLEDLLSGLRKPVIMDCKMGVRTFQEEELIKARTKPTPRNDMYQKMLKTDPTALSEEEHEQKGVTKWRYLQWRDTTTSTSTLGFRIEGVMMEDGNVQRDFRKIQTLAQVTEALLYFTRSQLDTLEAYHSRLLDLKNALRNSSFFRTHEVIGSSLLFIHDHNKASVWMIDFGKTAPLPDTWELQHSIPWAEGSKEDGYLIGLTSLISSLSDAMDVARRQQEVVCEEENVLDEVL